MKYAVEMASDGMIYLPSFIKTGMGIQVVLRLLPGQSERLLHIKFRDDRSRNSSNIKSITSPIGRHAVA
jgi:hypothetical protein